MKKSFFFIGCTIVVLFLTACGNKAAKSGFDELDQWAQHVNEVKTVTIGYPCNMNIELERFYQWYVANGLEKIMLNNVGDPFSEGDGFCTNACKFEREVIEWFGGLYGFDKSEVWGIVTNSGTDGNSNGMYFGTNYLKNKTGQMPVFYVSDEAHYSNARLADVMHLELRLIKSDKMGRMIPEELEKNLDTKRPALVVYAFGSTFRGAIDNIDSLNAVFARHPEMEVYRHVDGALFAGYLPFTQYRDMIDKNKHNYQSIAISGHKFFGMDEPAGLLITSKDVYAGQSQFKIAYLNEDMKMISCSRSATDALKFWWLMKNVGEQRWSQDATLMMENTQYLKAKLDEIGWPAWVNEYSNTVFFRRPSDEMVKKYSLANNYDEQFGGALSHIVVMQHVTKELIDQFISDIQQ